jgi:hypothetical protein
MQRSDQLPCPTRSAAISEPLPDKKRSDQRAPARHAAQRSAALPDK